jgi:hypothetical protein
MPYAHAVIVDPRTDFRYERGDEVPDDLPGLEALLDFGSVKNEPYEPEAVRPPMVLSAEQVDGLSPQARQELEKYGLVVADNHVNSGDGLATGDQQA